MKGVNLNKMQSTDSEFNSLDGFLHFELNYFTGVKILTPLANFPHTSKNEEKDIPHLVTKKFA